MRYYPIYLDLHGRPCTVVGGGPVAERKVRMLLRAGASVSVISPEVTPRLALFAARKKLHLTSRIYRSGDLERSAPSKVDAQNYRRPILVFAATNSRTAQDLITKEAETLGIPVNVADDAEESGFIVPATFSQGDLQVAISTSGASPALARQLRRRLQLTLGREYRGYLKFLREARKQVISTVPDETQRAKIFRQLTGVEVMKWLWKGPPRQAAVDVKKWIEKVAGTE